MFKVLTCLVFEHDLRLVVIAGLTCFLASMTAISLFNRARANEGRARFKWIIGAGGAVGCGIWATHFIAMLAYDPGIGVAYNVPITALSLLAATIITGVGIALAVYLPDRWGPLAGGAVVGGGVACMHYTGMSALELPAHIAWVPHLVAISIILGMILGAAALSVAARSRTKLSLWTGALILTLAIVSHHFTAMGAVELIPDPTLVVTTLSIAPATLAFAVGSAAMALLCIALITAFADRIVGEQNQKLDVALKHMPQALCMFDAEGRLTVFNQRYSDMYRLGSTGLAPGCHMRDLISQHFENGIFVGDKERYISNALSDISGGQPTDKTIETADGRIIAISNRPIPGGGRVSTHEDITERRAADKERIALLEQENRRVATEEAIGTFREGVRTLLGTVSNSAADLRTTADALSSSSSQAASRTAGAAGASMEASANTERVAAAAEELGRSITEISGQIYETARLVEDAMSDAHSASALFTKLEDSASEIGDVVDLIKTIAGQTNLLALNATIEAARAGAAGRGFAVVASEVKSLAVQTAQATERISAQIKAVQEYTTQAVATIHNSKGRMLSISERATALSTAVQQQNSATQEISKNVENAASATKNVATLLAELSLAISESWNSARTVHGASQAVEKSTRDLHDRVDRFLKKVSV
jgi:methyl-accepting chemotaxis protein